MRSILDKVQKPTEKEAEMLAKYFPSCAPKQTVSKFDPSAECVASSHHQKKKKFPAPRKSLVSVVMLEKMKKFVPRGKDRRELISKNLIKKIPLTQKSTSTEVNNAIKTAFNVEDFTILECAEGNRLTEAKYELTGETAIQRRGSLYLCKKRKAQVQVL